MASGNGISIPSSLNHPTRLRKRPRSSSSDSRVHKITPERQSEVRNVSSESDSDSGSCSECEVDSDSENECDTSFESPASSYCASPSLTTAPLTPAPKRPKTARNHTYTRVTPETDAIARTTTEPTKPTTLSVQRDEIVAAILTIASALGLTKETLHVCVDLLDRYLSAHTTQEDETMRLETLSIACLWLAVKFVETPETIANKSIKQILKRRRLSGNWTWQEIIHQETKILRALNFRLMAPTVLSLLQTKIYHDGKKLTTEQVQLAYYFSDLLLLKARAAEFCKELLVDAIWFIVTGHQIADVQAPLLAPVVILFLAHRDNINPKHAVFKTWFALRCQYGPFLQAPWQLPFDSKCECRVCEHTVELHAATASKPSLQPESPLTQ